MKEKLSFIFLALLIVAKLNAQEISKIRSIYNVPTDTVVTVQGVINCPDYGFNDGQFFVQDSTGGVNVFYKFVGGELGAITNYKEGDIIKITGQTGEFGNLVQIAPTSIEIIASGDQIPDPIVITLDDLSLASKFMGMRVEIANITLTDITKWPTTGINSSSGLSISATVASSKPIIIRIDRGQSFFDGSAIPNAPFTIRGILSRFNNDIQIFPFYEADIFQATTTNTFEALKLENTLKIYPNPIQDQITIEVLPQAGTVDQVTLYDLVGRTIAQWNQLSARNKTLTLAVPAGLNKGNYFISILTENGIRTSKTLVLK
jgi:hypothetical protein